MVKISSEILELYLFFSLIWLFNLFITWLKTGVMRFFYNDSDVPFHWFSLLIIWLGGLSSGRSEFEFALPTSQNKL